MTNSTIYDKSGFYETTLAVVGAYHITVDKDVKAELVLTLQESVTTQIQIDVKESADFTLFIKNHSEDSNLVITSNQLKDASLCLGLYELEDHKVYIQAQCHLLESGANVEVVSACISSNVKHFDVECIHHAPHTASDMKNFNISKENANYKMKACGKIEKGCYQSKSHQVTRILTTSDNQRSEAIPLLMIDENDVEASHANSMGKLDENHVYYMNSRGIDADQARVLLTLSYLLPICEVLSNEEINQQLVSDVRSLAGL